MDRDTYPGWPSPSCDGWPQTQETLHRYLQMVGKVRMALVPFRHHWWHTTLQLATRGISTGPMPYREGEVEIVLDLLDHRVHILTSDGRGQGFALGARPACADFYSDLFTALDALDVQVDIRPHPYDLGGPPFPEDRVHASYEPGVVSGYWRVLAFTHRVLAEFAARFAGEASPIQLFWHRGDLSYSRYGARPPEAVGAPGAPGADPNGQVIGFGFVPGDSRDRTPPSFQCWVAPEPRGLPEQPLDPQAARWRPVGGSLRAVLDYDVVRRTRDPRQALLEFYESAYRGVALGAGWDVAALRTPWR